MSTPRRTQVAEFIVKFHAENGKAPTTRQVAAHLGCSQNNAWRLMRAILTRGIDSSPPCAS